MDLSQDEINDIIEKYVELIILQYNDKPKAAQQIRDYVRGILSDGLILKIRDAFDIDTAIGNQLDILGKYIGIDRNGQQIAFNFDQNLFSTVDSPSELTLPAYGTVSEAQFPLVDSHIFNIEDDVTTTQILNDENYRFILKLKIIQNNINHSESAIDSAVNITFGGKLIPSGSDGQMIMTYIVEEDILTSTTIAFKKGVLPKPMAVGLPYLVTKPFQRKLFGFASNGISPNFVAGFDIEGNQGGKALFDNDLIFP